MSDIKMVDRKDFEIDGKFDRNGYKKAQLANGDICELCADYLMIGRGIPQRCYKCKSLEAGTQPVRHKSVVRCPHCRHLITNFFDFINDNELYHMYEPDNDEGSEVHCPNCEKQFPVITHISYTFESPEIEE